MVIDLHQTVEGLLAIVTTFCLPLLLRMNQDVVHCAPRPSIASLVVLVLPPKCIDEVQEPVNKL